MKKLLTILLLVIFCTSFGGNPIKEYKSNETNIIKVKVVDKETKEVLVGVKIEINNKVVYTDLDGNFSINNTTDSIKISFISYKSEKLQINDEKIIKLVQR